MRLRGSHELPSLPEHFAFPPAADRLSRAWARSRNLPPVGGWNWIVYLPLVVRARRLWRRIGSVFAAVNRDHQARPDLADAPPTSPGG
jgi:hypothetical protein